MCATWLTHLESRWRSLAWKPWLEAFSPDHTLLSHDSRGCGLSDRDPGDLSFEAWIRDFESVIDAANSAILILAACQHGVLSPSSTPRGIRSGSVKLFCTAPTRLTSAAAQSTGRNRKTRVVASLLRLGWRRQCAAPDMGACIPTGGHD